MLPQRETLPAVTAAGVVAILFSALAIIFGLLMQVVLVALPTLGHNPAQAPMPPGVRVIGGVFWFFVLLLGVGELFVAINVFRRKNWARITILIWAGIMAFFSAISCVAVFFFLSVMPQSMPNIKDPAPFLLFMKFFMLAFYGVPFAIAVWWLILFTRPRVVTAFQALSSLPVSMSVDASGFPAPSVSLPSPPAKKHSVPIPIAVIAALDVSGAVSMILMLFLPLSFLPPFFLFGVEIPNLPYRAFLGLLGVSYIVFVVGIFKLRRWALDSLMVVKGLFLLSGMVTLFNPRFMAAMDDTMVRIAAYNPALPHGQPIFSHRILEGMMAFSYAMGIALLIVMLIYRGRFLEAAAAKTEN